MYRNFEIKVMSSNPFEYINNISEDSVIKFSKEEIEQNYNPYLAVLYFSRFEDCVMIVNMLNSFKKPLGKYEHFLYLFHSLRKRKRFSKSSKKIKDNNEDLKMIKRYYECNIDRAREIIKM